MKLDLIYINEAKRIRETYLENLMKIVDKEEEIKKYLDIINRIKDKINKSDEDKSDEYYKSEILNIDKNINNIRKNILPYYDNIKKLDEDQRKLYNNIKEKYTDIKDEDIQNQIIPYIKGIDKKFIKKNKEKYDKLLQK